MPLSFLPAVRHHIACETRRKVLFAALIALCLAAAPARAAQGAPGPASAGEAHETEEHGRGIVDVIARAVNFAVFAGVLVYFLRSPIRKYLADRGDQVRSDLVSAADMRQSAAAQIEEIDRQMRALPGELDALRVQGAEAIAAEEARIGAAAAAERNRLLEQTRREIDLQVKVAERELVSHAADLAVGVASERIKKIITDEDQKRLIDRYVQQLKS